MKATITKHVENAKNLDGQKERVHSQSVVGIINGEIVELINARYYMARRSDGASPVYCSIWVKCPGGKWTSGHGKASGYGYHKQSAALQAAIDSAGIRLTGDNYSRQPDDATNEVTARIDGCGDRAMEEALFAIAEALGATGCKIV